LSKTRFIVVYLLNFLRHTVIKAYIMTMTSWKLFFLSALVLSINISKIFSQTVAIGHISAQVVEAVSTSSEVINDLQFEQGSLLESSSLIPGNVSLGSVQINSGIGVTCNLTIKPAILLDENGNDFSLEPIASINGNQGVQQIQGPQTVDLLAKADLDSRQASGLYQGSYTLVFAYN
jgi:hypothetical protein